MRKNTETIESRRATASGLRFNNISAPDKPRLLAECARVLQPGGRLVFSDILHRGNLTDHDEQQLLEGMTFSEIETLDGYAEQLSLRGMTVVRLLDLTKEWTRILVERHAMYRSLKSHTVARLGLDHFERYDRVYEHFVGLYRSGVLAGALIHAVKATHRSMSAPPLNDGDRFGVDSTC
jgi:hypothetical protein